jgi:predicted nucleotidyltransferase
LAVPFSRTTRFKRFRAAVTEIYGVRVASVVLFGSRARGTARPDSDYDVAVFLHGMTDRAADKDRLADLTTNILDDTGKDIHVMPCRAEDYNGRWPFMRDIRTDTKSGRPRTGSCAAIQVSALQNASTPIIRINLPK